MSGSVKIKFLGREYNIKSDKDEAYIQRLHKHVEEKAEEVMRCTGAVSSLDVAVLTLLNIVDDYFALRDNVNQVFESRLQRLIDSIEASMQ